MNTKRYEPEEPSEPGDVGSFRGCAKFQVIYADFRGKNQRLTFELTQDEGVILDYIEKFKLRIHDFIEAGRGTVLLIQLELFRSTQLVYRLEGEEHKGVGGTVLAFPAKPEA